MGYRDISDAEIEVLWESGVDASTGYSDYVQILKVEDSLVIQVAASKRRFYKRIVTALKYLIFGAPLIYARRISQEYYSSIWGSDDR